MHRTKLNIMECARINIIYILFIYSFAPICIRSVLKSTYAGSKAIKLLQSTLLPSSHYNKSLKL